MPFVLDIWNKINIAKVRPIKLFIFLSFSWYKYWGTRRLQKLHSTDTAIFYNQLDEWINKTNRWTNRTKYWKTIIKWFQLIILQSLSELNDEFDEHSYRKADGHTITMADLDFSKYDHLYLLIADGWPGTICTKYTDQYCFLRPCYLWEHQPVVSKALSARTSAFVYFFCHHPSCFHRFRQRIPFLVCLLRIFQSAVSAIQD